MSKTELPEPYEGPREDIPFHIDGIQDDMREGEDES